MIIFKELYLQNFQSVGNRGITIQLNKSPSTLISGDNGSGKSTVLEGLAYVCFGKTLKSVNLGGLINTINKKNLLTKVAFDKLGHTYKIVRGQKPNKLEFYVDDELVDQNASSKDYQAKIESVLGMDFKLFTQIILLNRERYVPFMNLSAADRRKVVEDILDISVFSVMNDLLKNDMSPIASSIKTIEHNRGILQERINGQIRLIEQATLSLSKRTDEIQTKINQKEEEIKDVKEKGSEIVTRIKSLQLEVKDSATVEAKRKDFEKKAITLKNSITEFESKIKFYMDNDICPECDQPIEQEIKDNKKNLYTSNISNVKTDASSMAKEYKVVMDDLKRIASINEEITKLNIELKTLNTSLQILINDVKILNKDLQSDDTNSISDLQDDLRSFEVEFDNLSSEMNTLLKEQEEYEICKQLLKDDGIKAFIIKDYIDFINSRVNDYLNSMEFYINIQLDESFNDSIKSVNRDGFTYSNLSTGQKTRVNLAIWLALLEVASIKNSVVSNIIFLDEILENLDTSGVSLFMKLVREKLPHKNTFVITQRSEEFSDYFRSEIRFKLEEGFTEIV